MLLTENEAGEKWCPHVRIARREIIDNETPAYADGNTTIVAGCNTDALGRLRVPASCRCIASGCAMWRWGAATTTHIEKRTVALKGGPGSTERRYATIDEPVADAPTQGYCSLAGVPSVAP